MIAENELMKPKVFCIGFHKTGTTSLAEALRILAYRVTGPNGVKDPDIARNVQAMADALTQQFDAFQDNPWPLLYRRMDEKFPGSKFILTRRDTDAWIKSQVRHFGRRETPMRRWIYGVGCPEGNEDTYVRRYETHNTEVLAYFKDRPGDLLVMDLSKNDGWEKLCPFLGAEIPQVPFPHANKATDRENDPSRRKKNLLKRLADRLSRRLT